MGIARRQAPARGLISLKIGQSVSFRANESAFRLLLAPRKKPAGQLNSNFRGMDMALDLGERSGTPGNFEIVEVLQVQPEFRVSFEITSQAQSRVRCDAAALVHNFTNACRGYVQFQSQFVH